MFEKGKTATSAEKKEQPVGKKPFFSRKPGENIDATGLLQRDVLDDAECPLDVIRSTRRKRDQPETALQNTLHVKY